MDTIEPLSPSRRRYGGSLQTIALVLVTVVAVGVAAFVVDDPLAANGMTSLRLSGVVAAAPPRPGEAAPAFSVTTTDGSVVHLANLKGRPVWLTFGASWCSECRSEAPDIEAVYQRFKSQGLVVLAVFQEDATSAKDYASRVGLTFTVGVDPDTQVASEYDVLGIPTHVFIGRDGVVEAIHIGALTPDEMSGDVQSLLR